MNMKHRHFTAIILLLAVAMGAAAPTLSERYTKNRPVVIVCNFKKPNGYYLEIANKIAARMGVEYRFAKHWGAQVEARYYYSTTSTQKQYMRVKDFRYNSTLALQAGVMYYF
jgi:hypothetical protein